jgi:hypothetical protein
VESLLAVVGGLGNVHGAVHYLGALEEDGIILVLHRRRKGVVDAVHRL